MIAGNSYNFVDLSSGFDHKPFIHNGGKGFIDPQPVASFEDEAYMYELYCTYKLWKDYKVWSPYVQAHQKYEDYWYNDQEIYKVPMMATRKVWIEELSDMNGFFYEQKYRPYAGAAKYLSRFQNDLSSQSGGQILWSTFRNNAAVSCAAMPVTDISSALSSNMLIASEKTKDLYEEYFTKLNNWNGTYGWKINTIMFNGTDMSEHGSSPGAMGGGDLSWMFNFSGRLTYKNGEYIAESRLPSDFGGKPIMAYYVKNSDTDDLYSYEYSSLYYIFNKPQWSTLARASNYIYWYPLFSIRMCPTWKFYKTTDPTDYEVGINDKKYWFANWMPYMSYSSEDPIWTDVPPALPSASGTRITPKILGATSGMQQASLLTYIIEQTGCASWSGTQPSRTVPSGYTAVRDGYKLYVDLAGVVVFRDLSIPRNMNIA